MAGDGLASIESPKPGGVIRGLGEKLVTTTATGTASFAVPLPITPGRAGLTLELTLSYDSGAGNGPFGLGWHLSTPAIARKTDKGLPTYTDGDEMVLAGAEDLVPGRLANGAVDTRDRGGFRVQRYRLRVDSTFSRIERWTDLATGDQHWRAITRNNVLSIYGRSAVARIAEPGHPERVFSWLLEETRDDRGNLVRYSYRAEDGAGVDATRASEVSRFNDRRAFVATAQRYLKRIQYGNRVPVLDRTAPAPDGDDAWLFEVVFDYGEHDAMAPGPRDDADPQRPSWGVRADPFSTHRSTFEVRTYRLCRRVLMFHRFAELGVAPALVRALELGYDEGPVVSHLTSAREVGYGRDAAGAYVRAPWPALELAYAPPTIGDELRAVDRASLDGIMTGVESGVATWIDLDGEGISGALIPSAGAWYYKAPLGDGRFAQPAVQASLPAPADIHAGQMLVDLGGDGNLDLVSYTPPLTGFFARTLERGWAPFTPLDRVPNLDWNDAQLRFVDVDGDGFPDVLVTENEAIVWYPSRAAAGFDTARRTAKPTDERRGPAVVFSGDGEIIQLADMSGDGLSDLVRVRNGEVCYWPNLGFGRFGAKVTLENSPQLDSPDQFDPGRVRFADVDGSGAADVIYFGRDGVRIYVNQSGNALAPGVTLQSLPGVDRASAVAVVDLLGRGTSCLVLSSPLARDPVTYVDLSAGIRPHLLVGVANNLGAETRIDYASSTSFYLADQRAGTPWVTRLPFPVEVVTRVETIDRIAHNRFVTRYAYHHGFFDGVEREFRGFGMVEQWDTEEIGLLAGEADPSAQLAPVHTKTWFHTGIFLGRDRVSHLFAHEYYREPAIDEARAAAQLLPDTVLPAGLTLDDEREACRALKGTMLRREVYAEDGSANAANPYIVTEQRYDVVVSQPRGSERHGVFFAHPAEVLTYHYERDPVDPRVSHDLTLEVDGFGNVLKTATIGYGRRQPDVSLPLDVDRGNQTATLITYVDQRVTNAIDDDTDYRTPVGCETRTYELTAYPATGPAARYRAEDLVAPDPADPTRRVHIFDGELAYYAAPAGDRRRRLVEHVRTIFRRDDLTGPLPLGTVQRRALPWDRFQLAFAPGMVADVYQRPGPPPEPLVPDPAAILPPGGFRSTQALIADNAFPANDAAGAWWIPSGQLSYSRDANDAAAQELATAEQHFFLPCRARDPFGNDRTVVYDVYDLNAIEARDAVGNAISARIDYRVLAPAEVRDANGNRMATAYDARGMVAGSAMMGPAGQAIGDSLAGFVADVDDAVALAHLGAPLVDPALVLGRATSRVLYDALAYERSRNQPDPQPLASYTLTREIHDADVQGAAPPSIQHLFSYRDGFGREIQKKTRAERGPVLDGGPAVDRWVGSGWTVFNNKGLAVREYEPFFTASHRFELARAVGVSSVRFYDPVGRAIATLHPDDTYEKVVFDTWRRMSWDENDTVLLDPRTDPDVAGFVAPYLDARAPGTTTWYRQRVGGARGASERAAADQAALHAGTPTTVHLDTLGRVFLTLDHDGFRADGTPILAANRVNLDIEGNPRSLRDAVEQAGDARGREVARYLHDLAGRRVYEASMEAGTRWTLDDVVGQPYVSWDSRGHRFRTERDPLRRPVRSYAVGVDAANPANELVVERLVYGEQHPDPQRNLRGALFLHLDQGGVVTDEQHDFKGNSQRDTRRLAAEYRHVIDWSAVDAAIPQDPKAPLDLAALEVVLAPRLEVVTFESQTRFDAINRPIQIQPPHEGAQRTVVQPAYNEASLLDRVDVWLDQAAPAGLLDPVANPPSRLGVVAIAYDARARRTSIAYRSGAITSYAYDRLRARLVDAYTRRGPAFAADCDNPAPPPPTIAAPPVPLPGTPCGIQNLHYTYDPVGNITQVRDAAQQTIYFANRRIDATSDYTYDPRYRLVSATGREHLGQAVAAPVPYSADDAPRVGLPHPSDGNALAPYTESFEYDAVGNLSSMRHVGAAGWTRNFVYDEASQLEPQKRGNRLTRAAVGAAVDTFSAAQDGYDAHGNMLAMPHLAAVAWSFLDQLQMSQRQAGANADRTYYVYDAAGARIRKVTETAAGAVREERIYLGTFERYRRATGGVLVRDTLHVMDGDRRIATIEQRTQGVEAGVPARVIRYQLTNHLGSTTIELDDQAEVLSYEEYSPYGSTTMRTGNAAAPAKRYGFSGKERDDETGLVYFGARYYAPWLGRWVSCDPKLYVDGPNIYAYVKGNPVNNRDPSGTQSLDQRIERIESPVGWFFARTGYDLWNVISFGTLSKVEAQENLGTLEGVGDSTFTGVRSFSNAASLGLQDRIYEAQMKEGPKGIVTGTVKAGEDLLPIAEADVLANPEASAEAKWQAGGLALAKTANLIGLGAGLAGKNPTIGGRTAKVKLGYETYPGAKVAHNLGGVELPENTPTVPPKNPAQAGQWFERGTTGEGKEVGRVTLRAPGEVQPTTPNFRTKVAEVEVPLSRARAALATAERAVAAGPETYNVATNNCTTLGTSMLGAAGVPIPALSPSLTFWIVKYLPFAPLALQAAGTTNAIVQAAKPNAQR